MSLYLGIDTSNYTTSIASCGDELHNIREIIDIKDVTNNQWTTTGPVEVPVTPETITQIEQLFFPDKAQIAEQFKNIMNRMNEL